MDRHFLTALALAALAALGCSNQDSKSQAPRPSESSSAAAPLPGDSPSDSVAAQTHRPIIVGTELEGSQPSLDQTSPFPRTFSSPPPPLSPGSFAPPTESPGTSERFSNKAKNPLRLDLAPPSAETEADRANPLRRIASTPGMAAPQPGTAPPMAPVPAAPSFPPPAGGAAPPDFDQPTSKAPAEPAAPAPTAEFPTAPLAMNLGDFSSTSSFPAAAAQPNGPFDVVEVFYGTDRLPAELLVDTLPARFLRFLPASCSALVTLCLAVVAASRRGIGMWLMALGALGVSLGLGFQATTTTVAAVRQSSKEGLRYTAERSPGGSIDLGLCAVTIPKTHVTGELESPSILRLEVREDAARHVVLNKTERLATEPFYTLLRQRVQASPRRELFVFVHGFNVTFEDAARRTAQIHHDVKFAGAPVFFSWPAHDKFVVTYPADENNVAWSTPHLKQFLLEIVKESQAQSINLVAHSMGNRALTAALREIELELKDNARLFNQVILAAPDIDADDFRHNIAPAMQRTAKRMTLYASSRDDALLASRLLHRGHRAGDAGQGLVVVKGIDTIDVTAIDSSPWGHSYYGSSDPVLNDLKAMLMLATPPHERTWLSPAEFHGLPYWIFQPARTAAADTDTPAPR